MSQNEAYDDCVRSFRFSFDWIAFIDADEFVQPLQSHSIKSVLADIGSASALLLNWCMFGSSGHVKRPTGLTIESFVSRAKSDFAENRHYKMIVRPLMVKRIANCHDIRVEGQRVFPDGTPFREYSFLSDETLSGYNICRLNHYFVKSRAHWAQKIERGYTDILPRTWHEFDHCDRNEIGDTSMLRYAPTVRTALDLVADLDAFEHANESEELLGLEKSDPQWAAVCGTVFVDIPLILQETAYVFDAEWYRREYKLPTKMSDHACRHHFLSSENEPGRRPNSHFDPEFYAYAYHDLSNYGGSLFHHFANAGRLEGRRPRLDLDTVLKRPPRYENHDAAPANATRRIQANPWFHRIIKAVQDRFARRV